MKTLSCTIILSCLFLISGCRVSPIERLEVLPKSTKQSVQVSLTFQRDYKHVLEDSYAVKDYGILFLNPYSKTSNTQFGIGFDLSTSIFHDLDYLKLTPTTTLPAGIPIPREINRPLVIAEVEGSETPEYILSVLIDLQGQKWAGVLLQLKNQSNSKAFPKNVVLTEHFLLDSAGKPRAITVMFGSREDTGTKKPTLPGIALLADIDSILKTGTMEAEDGHSNSEIIISNFE